MQLPFDTEEFDRLLEEHAKNSHQLYVEDNKVPSDVYKDRWQVNW